MDMKIDKKNLQEKITLPIVEHAKLEALESVMCDVILMRIKGGMRGEVRKETPKKEMDLDVFLWRQHVSLQGFQTLFDFVICILMM